MRKSTINYIDTVIAFMEKAIAGEDIIFFDLETTGLNPTIDKILSCSAVKYYYKGGEFIETGKLDIFINPGFHIPERVTEINGITDDMVMNAPEEGEAFGLIYNFFGPMPVVAGYNSVNFDQHFMENIYQRAAGVSFTPDVHLDVLKMTKEKVEMTSHKLVDVAKELGCDAGITFHRSIDDVYATARVFKVVLGAYIAPEEEYTKTAKVYAYRYWAPRYNLARVYVQTNPKTKTYYDIYQKAWNTDEEGLNLDDIRTQVLRLAGAENEKQLVVAAKARM